MSRSPESQPIAWKLATTEDLMERFNQRKRPAPPSIQTFKDAPSSTFTRAITMQVASI